MFPKSVTVTVSLLMLLVLTSRPPAAQQRSLDTEAIKAALRTETPEENGFIERVVGLVDTGVLPRSLVESTFQWARKKRRHKFQYFKRGMIVRAAKIGVQL